MTGASEETPCVGARSHDPGQPVWCGHCADTILDRLDALPGLAAALEQEAAGKAGSFGGGDRITGTKGTPSPSPSVDAVDELVRLLEFWEDAHREHAGHGFRPARAYSNRVLHAVHYLHEHLAAVLASPHAEEFGRDINRAWTHARRLTGQDQARTRKPIPCPGCDLLTLSHDAGAKYIDCRSCGRLLTFAEYDSWARLAAAGATTRRTA